MIARSEAGNFFFRPILMQFAAHWIGASYRDYYLDHQVLVQANLACGETLGMDAVGPISDPREAEALGCAALVCPDDSGADNCMIWPQENSSVHLP